MNSDQTRRLALELHLRAQERSRGIAQSDSYLQRVEKYYDYVTDLVLPVFGLTYQVGTVSPDSHQSNLLFANRAGVKDGMRILDAGCGWGGPALDIARAFPRVSIEGVTLSQRQVEVMASHIKDLGLSDRVKVSKADYHRLPHADGEFDLVTFLESSGHSETPVELFREVARVLKPGGRLYIKDPFLKSADQRVHQELQVKAVETLYGHKLTSLDETQHHLREAGFREIRGTDLSNLVDISRFWSAMRDERGQLTPFGKAHAFPDEPLELLVGEVTAAR